MRPKRDNKPKDGIESQLLEVRRVTRVMAGGKRMSFRAVTVAGDKKGKVGVGVAKGADVAAAIEKSTRDAKKNLTIINIADYTIAHDTEAKYGSVKMLMKPAKEGSGLIAGSTARAVCALAGISNVSVKILGRSSNPLNIARATVKALSTLKARNKEEARSKEETQNKEEAQLKEKK